MRRMPLHEQLDEHRINTDVSKAMRQDRAAIFEEISELLTKAEKEYQHAAAMHFESKCSYYGGQVAALKAVLKII